MTPATETFPEVPLTDVRLEPDDLEAVAETLRSGWLTLGPRTVEFEQAFAEYLGCRHAVAVSSCTAALHVAYLSAGVGPGDEVIVPSYTFAATASAVLNAGATPVFADIVGQDDLGIDPLDVERRITPRTKAVTAVHFAGYSAAVDKLAELCRSYDIALIEDVAHGPGGTLGGRPQGTFGLAGTFSFFSNKVLAAGEGGLLVTDDDDVADRTRRLRSYGMTSSTWDRHSGRTTGYDVTELGFNYKLDEPRAALVLSRLRRLDDDIGRRRQLVSEYRRRLEDLDGISIPYRDVDVMTTSGYVMPIMLADDGSQSELRRFLRDVHGVQTSLLYPAIHEFSAYRRRFPGVSLPRTEMASRTEVTIPLYPHMTSGEQDRVVSAIESVVTTIQQVVGK